MKKSVSVFWGALFAMCMGVGVWLGSPRKAEACEAMVCCDDGMCVTCGCGGDFWGPSGGNGNAGGACYDWMGTPAVCGERPLGTFFYANCQERCQH